jgi:hypothetical protein
LSVSAVVEAPAREAVRRAPRCLRPILRRVAARPDFRSVVEGGWIVHGVTVDFRDYFDRRGRIATAWAIDAEIGRGVRVTPADQHLTLAAFPDGSTFGPSDYVWPPSRIERYYAYRAVGSPASAPSR